MAAAGSHILSAASTRRASSVLLRVAAAASLTAATHVTFLSVSLRSFQQTANPNQNHSADKRNDDGPYDPSARPNPEHPEYPPAYESAKYAKDDVYEHPVSPPFITCPASQPAMSPTTIQ